MLYYKITYYHLICGVQAAGPGGSAAAAPATGPRAREPSGGPQEGAAHVSSGRAQNMSNKHDIAQKQTSY